MLDGVAAAAGPGPDRRRDRRPHHRQGDRAGRREAADRRQSSRGACADRAAHRRHGVSLLPVPRLGRAHADRRGARCRQLRAARHHASTTRSAKPSTRPPSCSASAIRAGRRSSARRRTATRERFILPRPMLGRAEAGLLALGPEDRAAHRGREGRAVERSGRGRPLRRVPAGGGRRRDATGCARACALFREQFGGPTALVVAGGVAVNQSIRRALNRVAHERGHRAGRAAAANCAPTTAR